MDALTDDQQDRFEAYIRSKLDKAKMRQVGALPACLPACPPARLPACLFPRAPSSGRLPSFGALPPCRRRPCS
jgi:hypothetical protein